MDTSLFRFDPDTGRIGYQPTDEELEEIQNSVENSESEVKEDGTNTDMGMSEGDPLSDPENLEEGSSELQEAPSVPLDLPLADDGTLAVSLPEDVTIALLDSTPAAGALGSSTLDIFDRVVGGLDPDVMYVAYRTSDTDSYSGILIFGDTYDVSGNLISFKDADTLEVWRDNDRFTHYQRSFGTNMDVSLSNSGSTIYYTNAVDGFPILGDVERPFSISPFIVVGLISAFAVAVLTKLIGGAKR